MELEFGKIKRYLNYRMHSKHHGIKIILLGLLTPNIPLPYGLPLMMQRSITVVSFLLWIAHKNI